MQTPFSSPPPSSEEAKEPTKLLQTPISPSPSPSPLSAATRLWRPSAQRNLRNQWSKLLTLRQQWASSSSDGRSHATSIVNAHLSHRYIPDMDLGVLSGLPDIRQRACEKLAQQQEHYLLKLLSSYKDMVGVVSELINTSRSMRCFLKGSSSSPIIQFGTQPEDRGDPGDGGGIPVFSSMSIPSFENLAQELVQMFALELILKRFLVLKLLSLRCGESSRRQTNRLSWSDKLYPGEFDDLSASELLYDKELCQPVSPKVNGWESGNPETGQTSHFPDRKVLQVYLTAWLVEVNIDIHRIDQIFAVVGDEMHVNLS